MESEYAIEVFNKKFAISFSGYYPHDPLKLSRITNCNIIEIGCNKIYSGATIKNPNDISDTHIARRWAFKRAVLMVWLVWTGLKHTDMEFKLFWQEFRQALAKNNLYLADRREN